MISKIRIDELITRKHPEISKEKAQRLIMAGKVHVGTELVFKASEKFFPDIDIFIDTSHLRFVSRGGYKLEYALKTFNINLNNKICLDIGASTGGFTDCMLQAGALKIFATDVGKNQLHENLINNERITVIDGLNFRYASRKLFPKIFDFVAIDVSFISLRQIMSVLPLFIDASTDIIVLIKPQFEGEQSWISKKGYMPIKRHHQILNKLISILKDQKFQLQNIKPSPITGSKSGNIEYLAWFIYLN